MIMWHTDTTMKAMRSHCVAGRPAGERAIGVGPQKGAWTQGLLIQVQQASLTPGSSHSARHTRLARMAQAGETGMCQPALLGQAQGLWCIMGFLVGVLYHHRHVKVLRCFAVLFHDMQSGSKFMYLYTLFMQQKLSCTRLSFIVMMMM